MNSPNRELQELAGELSSLAMHVSRAPTHIARPVALRQAYDFSRRLNALGWPNGADEIERARLAVERNEGTWSALAAALRYVASNLRAYSVTPA